MDSVVTPRLFHRQAMNLYEQGLAIKNNNHESAISLFKKAFELEKRAADVLKENVNVEPTRSVLYRSAGWMAFHAGMFKEAHEMAVEGKRFCIHNELKEELEDLFEAAYTKIK